MKLRETLSQWWHGIQHDFFPHAEEVLGDLTIKQQHLISTLEMVALEDHIPSVGRCPGRPPASRVAIASAFIAKSIYAMPTTSALRDRLNCDIALRRICGWEKKKEIPSESVFSRAFREFSHSRLPEKMHETLILATHKDRLVGHISRDSTAIKAREKAVKKEKSPKKTLPKKLGRPKKGEKKTTPEPTRIERQRHMNPEEMVLDLPTSCDIGTKKNSKGHTERWKGYKLHIDSADGGIPISCILTSASTHDSQAAIPLAERSAKRTTNCYDLMDAAYDDANIASHSRQLGHIPIIDVNPRRNAALKDELQAESKRRQLINLTSCEAVRYRERSTSERVNARVKDEFGGRTVRVRSPAKVMCHIMFGILALTADQLLRFVT